MTHFQILEKSNADLITKHTDIIISILIYCFSSFLNFFNQIKNYLNLLIFICFPQNKAIEFALGKLQRSISLVEPRPSLIFRPKNEFKMAALAGW